MKKLLLAFVVAAASVAALTAGSARAILFGTPDGNDHRGVGYIVFYDDNDVPVWRCTGSLVSSRVLLTAGHCAGTYDNSTGFHTPVSAQVWFDKQIRSRDNRRSYPSAGGVSCHGYRGWPCTGGDATGVPHAHPNYQGSTAEGTHFDIGVVVLDRPVYGRDVLDIAPLGTLDETDSRTPMTIVGFGTQSVTPPPVDQRQRMQGTLHFLRVEDGSMADDEPGWSDFTNFQAAGAAACHGDSGGPVIDEDGDVVAVIALGDTDPADSPFGDNYCQGIGYNYRTDTADSQQFLAGFGVDLSGDNGHDHGHGNGHGHGNDDWLRDLLQNILGHVKHGGIFDGH